MRIAVIGSGLAGLATAWELIQNSCHVTIYDSREIGKGTSGLAAGLLHFYAGAHAKKNWMGEEALNETLCLLEAAAERSDDRIYTQSGILRLAIKEEQHHDFALCAEKHDDVEWLSASQCQNLAPGISPYPGIYIRSGYTVNCKAYLLAIQKLCQQHGAQWSNQNITNLSSLHDYDAVIVCSGADTHLFPELSHLKVKPIKGQLLKLSWPENLPPLPFPINSKVYIVMNPDNQSCTIGATFEKTFSTTEIDSNMAQKELLPLAYKILPDLKHSQVIECLSGCRAAMPDHKPAIGHAKDNIWYFTGLGSKGLLYHAYFAKKLVQMLL